MKITDMKVHGAPRDLLPGDPLCAPSMGIIVEGTISLLRTLHGQDGWTSFVNNCILDRLKLIKKLIGLLKGETTDKTQGKLFS